MSLSGAIRRPTRAVVDEIENPNPQPGTNNWWIRGWIRRRRLRLRRVMAAEATVNCADPTQPGVDQIRDYLQSLNPPDRAALRSGPLLSGEQLQPRLFRRRLERLHRSLRLQHAVHDSPDQSAQHRRRADRRGRFVEVVRRSVDSISLRQVSAQLRNCRRGQRPVLQHLQPVPVRKLRS